MLKKMRLIKVSNAIDLNAAGSRTGGRISSQSSELDSPGIHSTVHSWDSHANYHGNYEHNDHRYGSSANIMPWSRASHLIFYCDIRGHLKTATGLIRLLLLISSLACLATLCSSGTAKVSLFMLPLVERLRFMIFVDVFCLLITALLLFLDISHIIYFFPFNWPRLNAWIFASIGVSYTASSALLALSVVEYYRDSWVPRRTHFQLTAVAALGLSCAFLSFLLSWLYIRNDSSCCLTLGENEPTKQLYNPIDRSFSRASIKDKVPSSWQPKNSKKNSGRGDSNSGNYNKLRKDHWATTRDHFFNSNQFDEQMENPQKELGIFLAPSEKANVEQRRQRRRRDADGISDNGGDNVIVVQTKISVNDDEPKKKALPKKLSIQPTEKARPRIFKDNVKKTTRTSVTRSEIQEYWMQGYEYVQRTDKTTANIEQWQSAAMKSLEEKKANDVRWTETWYQKTNQQSNCAKPCSSTMLESFDFA